MYFLKIHFKAQAGVYKPKQCLKKGPRINFKFESLKAVFPLDFFFRLQGDSYPDWLCCKLTAHSRLDFCSMLHSVLQHDRTRFTVRSVPIGLFIGLVKLPWLSGSVPQPLSACYFYIKCWQGRQHASPLDLILSFYREVTILLTPKKSGNTA